MQTPPLPSVIYVIRHGEKPAPGIRGVTESGATSIDGLIPRGWQRAGALASLFAPMAGTGRPGLQRPTALFSPEYTDPSAHRAYQTILPLSQRIATAIQSKHPVGNEGRAIGEVLASGADVALICWEHQHIPDLANALPLAAGTVIPSRWPGGRFDIIWKFELDTSTAPPVYRFSQQPQLLLAGDQTTVVPAKGRGRPGLAA